MAKTPYKKKWKNLSTFSASLTVEQIKWLRSHRKPQETLRQAIADAIEKERSTNLILLKKKEAELVDMHRLLTSSSNVDDKRRDELVKRSKVIWKEIEAVRDKISTIEYNLRKD